MTEPTDLSVLSPEQNYLYRMILDRGSPLSQERCREIAAELLRLATEYRQLQHQVADLAYEIGTLRQQHEAEKRALAERVREACSIAVIPSMDVGEARDLIASLDLDALLAAEPPK